MRAHRRLHAMQARARETHTLTIQWYSPGGLSAAGSDGMRRRTGTPEGKSRGKMQALATIPGVDPVSRMVKIGDTEVPVLEGGLHIPVGDMLDGAGQLRIRDGWEGVVVRLGPYDDPPLFGKRFRVVGIPEKSFVTARRLDVVDVTHLTVA